jgi:hypothetical protein
LLLIPCNTTSLFPKVVCLELPIFSIFSFLEKEVPVHISVCLCSVFPISTLSQLTDIHEIWNEGYAASASNFIDSYSH